MHSNDTASHANYKNSMGHSKGLCLELFFVLNCYKLGNFLANNFLAVCSLWHPAVFKYLAGTYSAYKCKFTETYMVFGLMSDTSCSHS